MAKKKVISEEQISNVINKVLNEYIEGNSARVLSEPSEMLTEMARINKKETGNCIFPYNAWELKIWSNDHNPPHFHIIRNGWNVSFNIETGKILQIESHGSKTEDYNYMISNVNQWLSSQCFMMPKITNRENAILQWEQLHDD